ncbi:MAG: ACT domain-containing protein [Candidatus Omnitrophica bacterium]|nr:ACT domain-containing protein [Candidatus Omnitrophota bacterium]
MIKRVTLGKEISLGVINEPGVLARITSFLVNNSINIEAILGYTTEVGQRAGLMFITDNNKAAIDAFLDQGFHDIMENDVLIVELENKPGALKNISELLARNDININYIYATACVGGCPVKVVLSTPDNKETFNILTEG